MQGSTEDFEEFLKTADLSSNIMEQYQAHLVKTQKAQTSFGKALDKAKEVLKGFGAALASMAVNWAIGEIISLAVKGLDELAHSVEHCKERVDELMSDYKSALDTANNNAKKVEELADKYEDLSKGVNNLGENVSLTNEEYKEYNSLVNEIADMFPNLVQGFTDEGNAILSLKGNVEQLRDSYRETQQEAYNLLISSGKGSDGNDIIKQWKDIHDTGFWAEFLDFGEDDVGRGISVSDALEQLRAIQLNDPPKMVHRSTTLVLVAGCLRIPIWIWQDAWI